jgi:O-antigen/teichoic acid export membrane protein
MSEIIQRSRFFFKKHSDYIITYSTEFFVILSGFFTYKLISHQFGDVDFFIFTLSKRFFSFLIPFVMVGCGVAIPRYISLNTNKKEHGVIFLAGTFIVITFFLISCIVSIFFNEFIVQQLFGSLTYVYMLLPILWLVFSLLLHALIYSYLRGVFLLKHANGLQFLNAVLWPLGSVYFASNVIEYFTMLSVLTSTTSVIMGIYLFIHSFTSFTKNEFVKTVKTLFFYGIQRLPGDVLLGLLFLFPSIVVSRIFNDLQAAGLIAFWVTLIGMFGAAFGPISLILLPKISSDIKNATKLLEYEKKLRILTLSAFGFVLIGFSIIYGLRTFIFYTFFELAKIAHLELSIIFLCIGSLGYVAYIIYRSFLDAVHVKSYNSLTISLTFALFVLLSCLSSYFGVASEFYLGVFSICLVFLGFLSFYFSHSYFNNKLHI